MDKLWVKLLTVILIAYTFIAGMIRPLNPGIMEVAPSRVHADSNAVITISTYNTRMKSGEVTAYLSIDSIHHIKARSVEILSPNEARVHFAIPKYLPENSKSSMASLVLAGEQEGGFTRPSSVSIVQDSVNVSEGQMLWSKDQITQMPEPKVKGFPFRLILEETIRNIYYHVPFWMAMIVIFSGAVFYAVRYLIRSDPEDALRVYAFNRTGLFYGIMGLVTGAIWAKNTWGEYWSGDIKQNMTAIALLIYAAYFILWKTFKDEQVQARVSGVFTIFAYVAMIPLLFVIPRLYDSLHPGNGGNPALGGEDLDNTMRMVFYPGVIGFTLLGLWISNIYFRFSRMENILKR